MQNAEASGIVFEILKADKSISLLASMLPGIAIEQFIKRCLIDEIILTNKIEGVYSTRREIASILGDLEGAVKEKAARKRFWGLVKQYYMLREKEQTPLKTCIDLRNLYNELVLVEVIEEDRGNAPYGELFRKESVSVHSSTEREIHRGIYPESAIISALEDALMFLSDETIEHIYRISVFHYLLGYIHPFYDGNGRLGRFIVSDLLSKDLNPLLAYRLSGTVMENINMYYNAFKTCNDPRNLGDVTPFLIMMLNMIKTSSIQLEESLRERHIRLTRYHKSIKKLPGSEKTRTCDVYFVLIQAGLFSENGVSTRELIKLLGSSYATAKKELDFISQSDLLVRSRIGKEYYYMMDLDKLDDFLSLDIMSIP